MKHTIKDAINAATKSRFLVINWKYLDQLSADLNSQLMGVLQELNKTPQVKNNSYIVCNTDEPYAKKVHSTILRGETQKLLPVKKLTTQLNRHLFFDYTNHKEELQRREVITLERTYFGSTKYCKERKEVIKCFCLDKNAYRTFAISDMLNIEER